MSDAPQASPFDKRCADALADEVAVLVRRKVIDSRSPAADALLDYRSLPSSPRADRLAVLELAVRRLLYKYESPGYQLGIREAFAAAARSGYTYRGPSVKTEAEELRFLLPEEPRFEQRFLGEWVNAPHPHPDAGKGGMPVPDDVVADVVKILAPKQDPKT